MNAFQQVQVAIRQKDVEWLQAAATPPTRTECGCRRLPVCTCEVTAEEVKRLISLRKLQKGVIALIRKKS